MKKNTGLIFGISVLVCWIVASFMFWKSLFIWLTPLLPTALTVRYCILGKYALRTYLKELKINIFIYVSILVGAISTILQFQESIIQSITDMASSLLFERIVTIVLVIVALLLIFILLYEKIKSIKTKKIVEQSKLDYEEQQKIRNNEIVAQKEIKRRRQEEGEKMLEALKEKTADYAWHDLLEIAKKGVSIPDEIVLTATFFDLIRISEIKKQIAFNPEDMRLIARTINYSMESCFKDEYLQKAKDQLKKLETLSTYRGYDRLAQIFKQYDLVH